MSRTLDLNGARLFAADDEEIVLTVPTSSSAILGIATRRRHGLVYVSVLERQDYEIPEWRPLPSVLDRSIVASVDDARVMLYETLRLHGHIQGVADESRGS